MTARTGEGVGASGAAMPQDVRVLVTGDRHWMDGVYRLIKQELIAAGATHMCEGGATGVDCMARLAANGLNLQRRTFPAKWRELGRAAGPIRNQQMLDEFQPHLVLAFHRNLAASKGTKDMVERARKAGVPVKVLP